MTYLLDVNVLLALTDPLHVHHDAAHRWFADTGHDGWATCPITENGFVRVASNPRYPNSPGGAGLMLELLRRLCDHPGHSFWPDDVTLRDLVATGTVVSHKQLTDLYLLGLASAHGGKVATFDQSFPTALVRRGGAALERITL